MKKKKNNSLSVSIVIPARYASTRFEGKPLAKINGRPMIYYVYIACKNSKIAKEVIVATDDVRIKSMVESFGGKAMLTSSNHRSGTDRVAEVAQQLDADIIVNVQGDEPLIHPDLVKNVVGPIKDCFDTEVVTLVQKIDKAVDFADINNVKAVMDKNKKVIFMSRAMIPYPKTRQDYKIYKQIGIYAFKRDYLIKFSKMKQSPLELIEGIELLRVIENGDILKAVEAKKPTFSVDTISDLIEVEKIIIRKNIK